MLVKEWRNQKRPGKKNGKGYCWGGHEEHVQNIAKGGVKRAVYLVRGRKGVKKRSTGPLWGEHGRVSERKTN